MFNAAPETITAVQEELEGLKAALPGLQHAADYASGDWQQRHNMLQGVQSRILKIEKWLKPAALPSVTASDVRQATIFLQSLRGDDSVFRSVDVTMLPRETDADVKRVVETAMTMVALTPLKTMEDTSAWSMRAMAKCSSERGQELIQQALAYGQWMLDEGMLP